MNKQKGFTLIELLVVIAIIAVLAGALLVAINPQAMIQKGRNSKRLQDMDTLVKAINLALADGEITLNVGSSGNSIAGPTTLDGSGYVAFTIATNPDGTPKVGLAKFVPTLPIDPLNATVNAVTYQYEYASDGTNFEVNGVLEPVDQDATNKMAVDGGNNVNKYELGTTLTLIN